MPKSIIETKPDSSLSIVDVVDELSHCQDELASAKGIFMLLESYFFREGEPLDGSICSSPEEHFHALQMVSRKAAEMMSSTHEKMSGLGESLRILGEVDGRSNAKA